VGRQKYRSRVLLRMPRFASNLARPARKVKHTLACAAPPSVSSRPRVRFRSTQTSALGRLQPFRASLPKPHPLHRNNQDLVDYFSAKLDQSPQTRISSVPDLLTRSQLPGIDSLDYFRIADHSGVIAGWLESKCQVRPLSGQLVIRPRGRRRQQVYRWRRPVRARTSFASIDCGETPGQRSGFRRVLGTSVIRNPFSTTAQL
jgi:hypothetical protein